MYIKLFSMIVLATVVAFLSGELFTPVTVDLSAQASGSWAMVDDNTIQISTHDQQTWKGVGRDKYEVRLKGAVFNKTDKLVLSYQFDRGHISKITALSLNGSVLDPQSYSFSQVIGSAAR